MWEKHPVVSIIVPIYKVEKYLQACIDSICAQTYPWLEIILVDDGSPDQCGDICDANSEQDFRITVVHKQNGGLSSARNAGLDIASGKYVAFIDSDDTIHLRFVEILVELCEQYHCDIAQCDFLAIAEDSLKLPKNPRQIVSFYDGKQALYELCTSGEAMKYTIACNKLYRKRLFEKIRYPVGRINEDEFITYLLFWDAKKVAVTNEYLYYYLKHTTSIMGQKFSVKRLDGLVAFKERLNFLKEKELKKEYFATLQKYFNLLIRDYELLKANVKDCEDICTMILNEKEYIGKQLTDTSEEKKIGGVSKGQVMKACSYPADAKIVLYGAGTWGRIFYQCIKKHHLGKVVGWVDNRWYDLDQTEFPIMPLDSLLSFSYDYILIVIQDQLIQKEVKENLLFWGVPRDKILTVSTKEI